MIIDEPRCLNSKGGRGGEIGLQPSIQDRVYSTDAVSTAVTTSFMPSILEEKIVDVQAIRMVRTEEGKALRKEYENGTIHHGFNEHRTAEPRTDGVSNTLSTVQKDNMLLETVKVKQATKDGYIECKVGGGGRPEFP